MKTTELLLEDWDKAEAACVAATNERKYCDAILLKHAAVLAELHGLSGAQLEAQLAWVYVIQHCPPRDTVRLLHLLRRHQVSFDEFHAVLSRCSNADLATIAKEFQHQGGPFSNN